MSRPVRIREHLAAEIELLAKEERRSLANMVEILLEQALKLETQPATQEFTVPGGVAQVSSTPRTIRRSEDPHFKPDFKK